MTVTTTGLTKAAGVAAAAAGAIFIGIQIRHPHLDLTSITTTEMAIRDCAKVLMAALAVAGFTGMYLSQVRRNGVLGLVGYLVISAGFLSIMCTAFARRLRRCRALRHQPGFVKDVIALATSRATRSRATSGRCDRVRKIQGVLFLVGGLLFGIALFRAGVLARWATVLLAVGGLVSIALSLMPDAFYRFLAYPNAIAMIGLGVSLWLSQRTASAVETSSVETSASPAAVPAARVEPSTVR